MPLVVRPHPFSQEILLCDKPTMERRIREGFTISTIRRTVVELLLPLRRDQAPVGRPTAFGSARARLPATPKIPLTQIVPASQKKKPGRGNDEASTETEAKFPFGVLYSRCHRRRRILKGFVIWEETAIAQIDSRQGWFNGALPREGVREFGEYHVELESWRVLRIKRMSKCKLQLLCTFSVKWQDLGWQGDWEYDTTWLESNIAGENFRWQNDISAPQRLHRSHHQPQHLNTSQLPSLKPYAPPPPHRRQVPPV